MLRGYFQHRVIEGQSRTMLLSANTESHVVLHQDAGLGVEGPLQVRLDWEPLNKTNHVSKLLQASYTTLKLLVKMSN